MCEIGFWTTKLLTLLTCKYPPFMPLVWNERTYNKEAFVLLFICSFRGQSFSSGSSSIFCPKYCCPFYCPLSYLRVRGSTTDTTVCFWFLFFVYIHSYSQEYVSNKTDSRVLYATLTGHSDPPHWYPPCPHWNCFVKFCDFGKFFFNFCTNDAFL